MKSTRAQKQLRVNDLVQFRLDGAEIRHIREYVREKERLRESIWYRGDEAKPLSEATLWRYIAEVDRQIAAGCSLSRKKQIRHHVAKRRNLYAKAVAANDHRTALAILDSEAKLLGHFPPAGVEVTGKNGLPIQMETTVVHIDLNAKLQEYRSAIRASALSNIIEGLKPALSAPTAPGRA